MRVLDPPQPPANQRACFTIRLGDDGALVFRSSMPSRDQDIIRRWWEWRAEMAKIAADLADLRASVLTPTKRKGKAPDLQAVADQMEAMSDRAILLREGGPGWVLFAAWVSVLYAPECRDRFTDEELVDPDAKLACGRALVAELVDDLELTFEEVEELAEAVVRTLQNPPARPEGEPRRVHVQEVRTFGVGQEAPATSLG